MDLDNKFGTLDLQKKLLELLKEFHVFCMTNNIDYSLDWGSLLGAIRHHGFIPWDDDLDIMVDRNNYEKIKSHIGGKLAYEHGTPDAIWVDRVRLENDVKDTVKPTLDIFIIDNAPNGRFSRKLRVLIIRFLQGMLKRELNLCKGNVLLKAATFVTYVLGRCFPRRTILTWYNSISQLSNKKQTKKKACYNDNFYDIAILYQKDVLDGFITVPFEDTEANITKGYHQALVDKFGPNYMTLPPEGDRKPKRV
jgi:lipopolysaccharide cholinephosphotransferase